MKSKVAVKINLKRPNYNYPPCNLEGRHFVFHVTIARNIPWGELVSPTLICGRLIEILSWKFAAESDKVSNTIINDSQNVSRNFTAGISAVWRINATKY
jgi:hypothetical protein